MGLFKRIREKRKQKIKEARVLEEFLGEKPYEDVLISGGRQTETEEYILGRLEKLLDEIKTMNGVRDEYYEVVDYINDIHTLEELDESEFSQLKRLSEQLVGLGRTQEEYVNFQSNLTPEQFNSLRASEDELENLLRRMKENESYYNTLRRDMGYLEGEKAELTSIKEKKLKEMVKLRWLSTFLVAGFIVACVFMFAAQFGFDTNIRIPFLIAAVCVAIIGVSVLIRLQIDQREVTRTEKNLNYAVKQGKAQVRQYKKRVGLHV